METVALHHKRKCPIGKRQEGAGVDMPGDISRPPAQGGDAPAAPVLRSQPFDIPTALVHDGKKTQSIAAQRF